SRSAATRSTKSSEGNPSRAATTAGGRTTGDATATSSARSTVSPTTPSVTRLTVSVTGRTPTTTTDRSPDRTTQSAMNAGGVIGHSASCRTNGSSASTSIAHAVRESTWLTPASPSAHDAHATSASPWISVNGSDPWPVSTTAPSAGGTSYSTRPTYGDF